MTRFVYFDVGGVVLLDFSGTNNWSELKRELGVTTGKEAEFEQFWKKYEPEVCIGRDVESLVPLIKQQFGTKLPENYSLLIDGFVNRFKINKSIWPVIEKAHQKYKIGLLTNQYPKMLEAIQKNGLMPNIAWDVIVDSSVDRVRKPDRQIFELAERRSGFKGQEILFVENGEKHVRAATEFGWQTFLYDSKNYEEESKRLGELF